MKSIFLFLAFLCLSIQFSNSQELEKQWLSSDNTTNIEFKDNTFKFTSQSDSLIATGDYIKQNNLLITYFSKGNDSIQRYKINTLTDSTLTLSSQGKTIHFNSEKEVIIAEPEKINSEELSVGV